MKSLVNRFCVGLKCLRHRVQKTILEAAKENKDSDTVQEKGQQDNGPNNTKRKRKQSKKDACTVSPYMSHTDAQHIVKLPRMWQS